MRLEGDARAEWRRHWPVVLAASIGVAGSTMHSYSIGLFIDPLQREFGWSRTQITSGPALVSIACIFLTPFIGAAVDRYGPRLIAIPGLVAVMLLTTALGALGPRFATWMAIWALFALIAPFVLPNVWAAAVSGLFRAGRGLALGLTLVGSGISSIVTPLVTYWLIERFGWRLGFLGLAVFWGSLSLPLALAFLRGRKEEPLPAAPPSRQRLASSSWRDSGLLSLRFFRLALAALLFAAIVPPLVISIVPVLTWSGVGRAAAAELASLLGVAAIGGRIGIGYLLDRIDGRYLAVGATILPLSACVVLLLGDGTLLAATVAALCLGFALGAEFDIVAYMASRYFPIEHFGLLFGTLAGLITFAGAGGPLWISAIYDETGAYRMALELILPLCPIAAFLFLSLGPYPANPSLEWSPDELSDAAGARP